MKGNFKKDKVLYISHSLEFLLWLLVILFFVALSSMGLIFKEKNDKNDYQIFLQDVDGLIVGSPVRMMGIEVGHVTKIKPLKDEVYVKFILTNPEVFIPQGTNVTVEFSGLAGSKSLELYLPDNDNSLDKSIPLISIQPPKRLYDALSLLNDMFKKLESIIHTSSSFGTKLQSENIVMPNIIINNKRDISNFLDFSDIFLEESNKKATDMRNSIKELKSGIK